MGEVGGIRRGCIIPGARRAFVSHQRYSIQNLIFTPSYVCVSTEYVNTDFNYDDRVIFSVAPAVEVTNIPAVNRGAVTQQPLRIIPNSRRQELSKVTLVNSIVRDYSGSHRENCN